LEIDTADSSLRRKTPDVLNSWLNNAGANQIPKDVHLNEKPNKTSKIPSDYSSTTEPEILRTTNSIFARPQEEKTAEIKEEVTTIGVQPTLKNDKQLIVNSHATNSKKNLEETSDTTFNKLGNEHTIIERHAESFLKVLKKRATTSPAHQLYLQNSAENGNSWAKLEIAATWLSNSNSDQDQAQSAINYLNELANSRRSHLGAETEACYFLGEIYRIGFRYTHPNEDLSFKYLIRAAALGHKTAQHNLAKQLVHTANLENKSPLCLSLINNALQDRESSHALLQLIEFDWSITYIESVDLILRTLVDQGNGQAASFLGRILLEQSDYETAASILDLADTLDDTTINKIIDIINNAQISGLIINSLVDIIRKHAKLNNSYANYQIALAFSKGIGLPQDKMMAFVHVTIASARVYGQERDRLIKLRDELHETLTKEEVTAAQEIIRRNYTN
jgi:TPR repeat protein